MHESSQETGNYISEEKIIEMGKDVDFIIIEGFSGDNLVQTRPDTVTLNIKLHKSITEEMGFRAGRYIDPIPHLRAFLGVNPDGTYDNSRGVWAAEKQRVSAIKPAEYAEKTVNLCMPTHEPLNQKDIEGKTFFFEAEDGGIFAAERKLNENGVEVLGFWVHYGDGTRFRPLRPESAYLTQPKLIETDLKDLEEIFSTLGIKKTKYKDRKNAEIYENTFKVRQLSERTVTETKDTKLQELIEHLNASVNTGEVSVKDFIKAVETQITQILGKPKTDASMAELKEYADERRRLMSLANATFKLFP